MAEDQKKKVLLYVGIGCGALLLLTCCATAGLTYYCTSMFKAPADSAHTFFRELREGDFDSARKRMGASYQASHDVAAFERSVRALPALVEQSDSTFTQRNIRPDGAELGGHLTTPSGPGPVEVSMSQVGEHWYIDRVQVRGVALE